MSSGRCCLSSARPRSKDDRRQAPGNDQLVEGGRRKEWRGRLVNPPVERASTILFDSVADWSGAGPALGDYRYGLQGTATHWALVRSADRARAGRGRNRALFVRPGGDHHGVATVLSPGDELLVPDNVYGPTRKFCDTILKRFGVARAITIR